MNLIYVILKIYLIISITCKVPFDDVKIADEDEEIIELKDNDIKLPSPDDKDILYIPIIHTNDIHGSFYPKKITLPSGYEYYIGGLEYLGKYISIMYEEWKDRLLYLDSGDQFQGGLEGYLSKGQIIMDFFNELKVKKAVVGNHEFDYGIDFLKKYMNSSNFEWVIDNIKNKTSGEYITFPKQERTAIIEIAGIKLGIIGLATVETPASTTTKLDDLEFEDYIKIINEESNKLKNEGVNAILVLGHIGLYCRNDLDEVKLEYKLRTSETKQKDCRETDEATILLNQLDDGLIDILLGGHRHDVAHHWINKFPVMSNDRNGKNAQIVYLPFNRTTKELIKEKIVMEGPLPICEKVFKNKKLCDLIPLTLEEEEAYGKLVKYKFHNKIIEKEDNITKIGKKYRGEYNKYDDDFLTVTYDHFEVSKEHENAMGNFYTDFLRQLTGADIAVVNPGAFRTPFYRGNITNATIHSFDPFGNKMVKFEAKGWEVKKIFSQIQQGSKGFYQASGVRMVVRDWPTRKLISIKLYDGYKEEEIEDEKLYTMVSLPFCFPIEGNAMGGDDFRGVYRWFRPRNGQYVQAGDYSQSRDALITYLRNIEELKANKYYDVDNQRMRIVNENINDSH